jgi:hypothetical protein
MISDDVAGLLMPDDAPAVRFRQGTVTAWDPATGSNTIDVAGGTLTDLPILNTGEAIALKAGHVVGLLVFGRTWFILGRITAPGDPNFAAASVAFDSAGAQAFGFSTSTSSVIKATSSELVVPAWADEAIVMVTGMAGALNTTASLGWLAFDVGCLGGSGGAVLADVEANRMELSAASSRNHFTGLSGGEVLTVTGSVQTNAAWAVNASNSMFIHAIALYKSNV